MIETTKDEGERKRMTAKDSKLILTLSIGITILLTFMFTMFFFNSYTQNELADMTEKYETLQENCQEISSDLCNAGVEEFCKGRTEINICSKNGTKNCRDLYNGKFCKLVYCDETATFLTTAYISVPLMPYNESANKSTYDQGVLEVHQ